MHQVLSTHWLATNSNDVSTVRTFSVMHQLSLSCNVTQSPPPPPQKKILNRAYFTIFSDRLQFISIRLLGMYKYGDIDTCVCKVV